MKRIILITLFVLGSASQAHLGAFFENCCQRWLFGGDHQIYAGPEIYHIKRTRDGGSKQYDVIYGVRFGYQYLNPCKVYWAADGLYGYGHLKGKSASDEKIKSHFTDFSIEGRLGFTFCFGCRQWCFTPYVGYGYASEKNRFVSPSPLLVHFKLDYQYVPVGFLSSVELAPGWLVGINGKVKFLIDARNKVTRDEQFGTSKMLVKNKIHYRVELPLTYYCGRFSGSLIPFYEFRHYGGHPNFPFDFLETKCHLYGATFKIIYTL